MGLFFDTLCYLDELVDTDNSQYLHAMEIAENEYEGGPIRMFSPQSLGILMGVLAKEETSGAKNMIEFGIKRDQHWT